MYKDAQINLFLEMLLEGLDVVRWGGASDFATQEGIQFDYASANPTDVRNKVVDYLIGKAKLLQQGGMP
jgi:hypothetical protein